LLAQRRECEGELSYNDLGALKSLLELKQKGMVTKLEILGIYDTLKHRNVAVCFERHHSQRTSGKHIADDEFCNMREMIPYLALEL
jgi:hypothetical protein